MASINSRWRKGAVRYSSERTVEQTRFVRTARGIRRVTDSPTEVKFCERSRQPFGWRGGARGRLSPVTQLW